MYVCITIYRLMYDQWNSLLLLVKCLENHFVHECCIQDYDYFLLKSNGARNDRHGLIKRGRNPVPFSTICLFPLRLNYASRSRVLPILSCHIVR